MTKKLNKSECLKKNLNQLKWEETVSFFDQKYFLIRKLKGKLIEKFKNKLRRIFIYMGKNKINSEKLTTNIVYARIPPNNYPG